MQYDYIMRMIEQFVQALASIIRFRIAGKYEQAFEEIKLTSQRYLSTDIASFIHYTPQQLVECLKKDFSYEQAIICADLLYELAIICEKKENLEVSLHLKTLSLNLYLHTIPLDKQFQTKKYREKIANLKAEVDKQFLPSV